MIDERGDRHEREIALIQQRNARVEADKAWEISRVRTGAICCITYLVAFLFLHLIGTKRAWLYALEPALGFYLSAHSLPILKNWWINSVYSKR